MQHKILLLFFTCISALVFGQTNKGKDLVFRVKTEKTSAKILPDLAWLEIGIIRTITIRIRPAGRKIGKVTFKGGTITGQDSTYQLTPGNGTEGILSVYEKTLNGNKLIMNKVYSFKKVLVTKPKGKSQWHVVSPHYK
jgi:hypothetical protein